MNIFIIPSVLAGSVTFCNGTNDVLSFAMIAPSGSRGWFNINSGQCIREEDLSSRSWDGELLRGGVFISGKDYTNESIIKKYKGTDRILMACIRDTYEFFISEEYRFFRDDKNDTGLYKHCEQLGESYSYRRADQVTLTWDSIDSTERDCTVILYIDKKIETDCGSWHTGTHPGKRRRGR